MPGQPDAAGRDARLRGSGRPAEAHSAEADHAAAGPAAAADDDDDDAAVAEPGPDDDDTGDDGGAISPEAGGGSVPVVLPEPVRLRVIAMATEAMGALGAGDLPPALRQFVRFAPHKRAKLAATPIAAALASDGAFRAAVAARVRATMPELAAALANGAVPAAAEPADIGAVAYLLRFPGWHEHLAAAGREAARTAAASGSAAAKDAVVRLQEQLAGARAAAKADAERLRGDLDQAKAEVSGLRRRLHEARQQVKEATAKAREADEAAETARAEAAATQASADAELRRMKTRLADAEQGLESARRAAREGRGVEDVRLRLLLDTVLEAAQGLRRELALPPTTIRPADAVEALAGIDVDVGAVADRARTSDDPALLDQLLGLPQVHLVIDGYNVTKTGFASLPLESQRARLVGRLGGLAAQSGAEITCVFDGAALDGRVSITAPRGVRVLFSKPGETADDLIRRLVQAEPPGRPVVVVSSDREIADGVQRLGARALPATALTRRLSRG